MKYTPATSQQQQEPVTLTILPQARTDGKNFIFAKVYIIYASLFL